MQHDLPAGRRLPRTSERANRREGGTRGGRGRIPVGVRVLALRSLRKVKLERMTDDAGGPDDERASARELLPMVYEELRGLAAGYLRAEPLGHTLQPTALVHEVFLRVSRQSGVRWKNPGHLRAVAAQAMRRVLVDHARAKQADKRGGGRQPVTLVSELMGGDQSAPAVLALEAALEKLAARSERQARIVELRFFAGMTIPETAAELEVSETTVEDDWRFARAWLNRELSA